MTAIQGRSPSSNTTVPFLDRGVFRIPSDSTAGLTYELRAMGVGGLLLVSCDPCPTSKRETRPGVMHCKHRKRVAEALREAGLVYQYDRRWRLTAKGKRAPEIGATRRCTHRAARRREDPETGVVSWECACGRVDVVYDPTS